jgi:hypothetical protein
MFGIRSGKTQEAAEAIIQRVAAKAQRNAGLVEDENRSIDNEMNAGGGVDFAYLLSQDELISDMFDPSKPATYKAFLDPLKPLASRLNFLTKYDERGLFGYQMDVDVAIAQRKNAIMYDENGDLNSNLASDYETLENLRCHLHTRAYDSVMGFKVEALTTRRKIVDVTDHGPAKPPGLLASLTGQGGQQ